MKTHFSSISFYRNLSYSEFSLQATLIYIPSSLLGLLRIVGGFSRDLMCARALLPCTRLGAGFCTEKQCPLMTASVVPGKPYKQHPKNSRKINVCGASPIPNPI